MDSKERERKEGGKGKERKINGETRKNSKSKYVHHPPETTL